MKGSEKNMKTRIVIMSIMTLAFAVSMCAQGSLAKRPTAEARFDNAKKNIFMGLRSGNAGVVEGSMILIAKIKMTSPETNIVVLKSIIDSIAFTSSSPQDLRYRANVISYILGNPEWFAIDNTLNVLETDWFFASAARLLQNRMLSTEHS